MISIVGHTAIDHLFRVPNLPPPQSSTYIITHHTYFGGGGANVAAGIARLGNPCTLISAVGDDFAGSDYDQWMATLGIHRQFFTVKDRFTPTAYIYTDDTGAQVTFFDWGASTIFHDAEAPALDFVHLATADPSFNVRVAEKSTFCSFDPGQDLPWYSRRELESIISSISILFANRHEMARICKILKTTQESLVQQVPIVVLTMDVEGSTLFIDGTASTVPIVPVDLVDPTGAGDAYRAGFLTAYYRGYPPLVCGRVGTVTASFTVERVGCQTNLPTWNDMEDRYSRFFGLLTADVTP